MTLNNIQNTLLKKQKSRHILVGYSLRHEVASLVQVMLATYFSDVFIAI